MCAMFSSINVIGPTEVGLVQKRFSFKKLPADNPIAFHGEAGYQADAADAGRAVQAVADLRGEEVPVGAGAGGRDRRRDRAGRRPAADRREERRRTSRSSTTSPNLATFIDGGGQKGVQRPVLTPGTLLPIHPVAFLVVTSRKVYGLPVSPDLSERAKQTGGVLRPESFGLAPEQLQVVVIAPRGPQDMIGIVTTLEGPPLPSGDIASRLGGFDDIAQHGAGDRRDAGLRSHRGAARLEERPAQQLSGLPEVPRRPAATSVCSTTRCCTARTC